LEIVYLHNSKIDKQKWDACIAHSQVPLIYATSSFLDIMVNDWDGIVVNNYEAVLPISFKKKYGIKYAYQPAFTAQLGLFTNSKNISFVDCIDTLQKNILFADMCLNETNKQVASSSKRLNFILNLNTSFENITNNFKQDLKNNIKKALKANLIYNKVFQPDVAIDFYAKNYAAKLNNYFSKDFDNLKILAKIFKQNDKVFTRAINDSNNNIFAIGLFLKDVNRIYNICNSITTEGKKTGANHLLFYKLIEEFAQTNYILDFEGSDMEGIKSFYEKFNPQTVYYYHHKYNKLPWFIKLFKS
jgi:hypothetical protein